MNYGINHPVRAVLIVTFTCGLGAALGVLIAANNWVAGPDNALVGGALGIGGSLLGYLAGRIWPGRLGKS